MSLLFERILRRYFGVIPLGCVAVVAYLHALAIRELIASALVKPRSAAAFASCTPRAPLDQFKHRGTAKAILSRNAFDSITGPIDEDLAPSRTASELAVRIPTDPLAVPPCADTRAVIVTESNDLNDSIAALQGTKEAQAKLTRIGDEFAGMRVAYIGYNPRQRSPAVWLIRGSELCQTLLFARQVPVVAAESNKAEPASLSGQSKFVQEIASKIKKVDDHEFHIERIAVEKLLAEQDALFQAVRVLPDRQDGNVVGLRLLGIRPDTVFAVLGLKNGDRLDNINGYSVASPEKLLEVYMRLRTAEGLRIEGSRDAKPFSIDYKIL